MRAIQGQHKEGLVVGNRYQIEEFWGMGGHGPVYGCRDLSGAKSKLLLKTMPFINSTLDGRQELCRNLSLLQRLRHPNIVRILDFGIIENSGELFLIEERLYGTDVYSATVGMECEGVLSLVIELCKGLQYLHSHGIVHGNLKPSCVFVPNNEGSGGKLKLMDFHLSSQFLNEERQNERRTLSYTAPEILTGGSISKISDLYALGILLYQLLTRNLPFEDEDVGFLIQKQLQGTVDMRPIERLRNGNYLVQLIRNLLEKNPTKRMASAEEVIAFIGKAMNENALELDAENAECALSPAPFVGREREMGILQENALRVRDQGRGWTVFIMGEAGSGKSRCMEELRTWALLEGWRVVEGACGAGEESAYGPYRQILSRTDPMDGEILFRFSNLPRIAASDPFDSSSGFAAGQFQDLLTRELVRRLAERPTILFLHDFQWADKATCSVLDYLSSDIQAHPVLLCVSLRSGEESKGILGRVMEMVLRHERGESLSLNALSKENIRQMVVGMMEYRGLPEALVNRLFQAVGGNPFFLEEMLKHFVEQGVLRQISSKWRFFEEKLKGSAVPESIDVVLQKRLQSLSSSAKSLIEWLSLFHRAVSIKSLSSALSQSVARISETVNELVQRQMVKLAGSSGMEAVDFTHELIAEMIRGSLSLKQSIRMHRKIAEVIELEGGAEHQLHELAMHHMEGKSDAHSMQYVLASAARFRAEFAHENALRCFEFVFESQNGLTNEELCRTAIDASDTMFALGMAKNAGHLLKKVMQKCRTIEPELRARMYMQLALSYQYVGDFGKQESCCKSGLRIFERHPIPEPNLTKAMLWTELAFGAVMQSRSRQGLSYLNKALMCCPEQNATALRGRIQIFYASLYCVTSSLFEALTACEKAACILGGSKESYLACSAVSTCGGILTRLGRFNSALEVHKKAVNLSDKNRSVVITCQALGNLAECLCRMGRIQEALNALESGAKSVDESNNPAIRHAFNTILAEVKFAAGCYREARQIVNDICQQGRQRMPIFTIGHAYYISAYLDYLLGDFPQALKTINQLGRKETAEAPFYERQIAEALRARILFEEGAIQEAIRQLQVLDQAVARKHWPYQMCIIKIHIAEIYLKQCALKQAERYAKNALRLASAMGSVPLISHARLLLGLIDSPLRSSGAAPHFGGHSDGSSHFMTDRAIEHLKICCQPAEPACHPETTWRALSELSFIYKWRGNWAECLDYAEKAYECLCKLEDQIPSNMLCAFYGVFDRSRIKLELIRLMETGRKRALQRATVSEEYPEDENTRVLLRLSNAINSIRELDSLLKTILDQMIPAIAVERAFIFLPDESNGNLLFSRGRTFGHEDLLTADRVNRHILETVYKEGRPWVSMDLAQDQRLTGKSPNNPLSGKLLCAPLKASGRVIGVFYADRPVPENNLSESAINLFAAACNLTAIAIDNIGRFRPPVFESKAIKIDKSEARERYPEIIGKCPEMDALRDRIGLAADSPLDILITGESGTGKELVARAIARTGRRREEKFVPVDCGALSDTLAESELFGYRKGAFTGASENRQGLLEAANGGILFLDEVSNMPLRLQAKLLRILQEREVRRIGEITPRKIDIQVIAATNKDLMEETRSGRFRQDLLYRLKSMEIRVPPLRDRLEDIPLLVEWFMEKTSEGARQVKRFLPDAMVLLKRYSYPGNLRELKNIVANAYYSVHGPDIDAKALPPEVRQTDIGEIHSESDFADRLYEEILSGKGNFYSLVKEPFMRHQFGSAPVRGVLQRALRDTGGRYRDALPRLGVPDRQYSTTMQFLKRHHCYVDYRPFRRKQSDSDDQP